MGQYNPSNMYRPLVAPDTQGIAPGIAAAAAKVAEAAAALRQAEDEAAKVAEASAPPEPAPEPEPVSPTPVERDPSTPATWAATTTLAEAEAKPKAKPADWFDEAAAAAQAKVDAPAKSGRDLWKAYHTAAGGKSRLGEPLPQSWDDLTEDRQVVWNLAASAFLA